MLQHKPTLEALLPGDPHVIATPTLNDWERLKTLVFTTATRRGLSAVLRGAPGGNTELTFIYTDGRMAHHPIQRRSLNPFGKQVAKMAVGDTITVTPETHTSIGSTRVESVRVGRRLGMKLSVSVGPTPLAWTVTRTA